MGCCGFGTVRHLPSSGLLAFGVDKMGVALRLATCDYNTPECPPSDAKRTDQIKSELDNGMDG